jgi:hypothetical protein
MLRKQLGQFRDFAGNAPGLIARHQMRRRSPPRLVPELGVSERGPIGVADDVAVLAQLHIRVYARRTECRSP